MRLWKFEFESDAAGIIAFAKEICPRRRWRFDLMFAYIRGVPVSHELLANFVCKNEPCRVPS